MPENIKQLVTLCAVAVLAAPAWAYALDDCAVITQASAPVAQTQQGDKAQIPLDAPVKIQADEIDFPRRNVVHLRGYTQLIRGGHRVYADELIFDKEKQQVEARGLVTLKTPRGDVVKTSVLHYDVNRNHMKSGPAEIVLASREASVVGATDGSVTAHGTADQVVFEGADVMHLKEVKLTTCLDGKDDLVFAADDLKVDLEKGLRVAKRAKVRLLTPHRHPQITDLIN
jgi:lipopolysaccharide assembly outer membrane protein LptD (OstA)